MGNTTALFTYAESSKTWTHVHAHTQELPLQLCLHCPSTGSQTIHPQGNLVTYSQLVPRISRNVNHARCWEIWWLLCICLSQNKSTHRALRESKGITRIKQSINKGNFWGNEARGWGTCCTALCPRQTPLWILHSSSSVLCTWNKLKLARERLRGVVQT